MTDETRQKVRKLAARIVYLDPTRWEAAHWKSLREDAQEILLSVRPALNADASPQVPNAIDDPKRGIEPGVPGSVRRLGAAPQADGGECPDCRGSGWWLTEGPNLCGCRAGQSLRRALPELVAQADGGGGDGKHG